jgi:sterol desaturase/sphingolipid hydroxylase (fatty acid hydroxylase superfamily)
MLKVLASILCYDIWFYASHIFLHRRLQEASSRFAHKYMWKIHSVHHSTNPDTLVWSHAYVSHPIEDALQGLGMFFPYMVCTYNIADTALILLLLNLRGMARHDHRIAWPHHLLHHKYMNYNYGEYWIDCACGTLLRC